MRILHELDLTKGKSQNTIAKGDAWLGYLIVAESGIRRSALCRRRQNDNQRDLHWKNVNWMRNVIIWQSKSKIKSTSMTDMLREALSRRKRELDRRFDPEAHIIRFTPDTLTHYVKAAMRRAGINKPGALHIVCHSVPLQLLDAGADAFEVQQWMGHSDIKTTEIYVHMRNEKLQQLAKRKSRFI